MHQTVTNRLKITLGTLQAKGLFNVTDTATGQVSYWYPVSELKEVRALINDCKSAEPEEGERGILKIVYSEDYKGLMLRKNRFQEGYWCLDYVKIESGELKYESFIAQSRNKSKMLQLFQNLKYIVK